MANSTQPFTDLKTKYGAAVKKFGIGAATGYVAGYAVKRLAISVIKAVSLGAAAFAVAVVMGWAGKDQSSKVFETLREEAKHAEDAVFRLLDFNRDGQVDQSDLRELARRAERAVLKGNLPFTFGTIVGAAAGVASATLSPFD
eukprot:CAMPEP_0172173614 /NCGR_PEP_ID=MMETSP1050-20130122/13163_1 /TAXON_ID=233186 /ORGANISM="Cryptomonas curvata, Strain CCAP979/52" /LENGTH=142 /DNA_ID=CAMNT_0012845411 /DNA_START=226 /DNA_END=654 /DNA_ORIENTATION=-